MFIPLSPDFEDLELRESRPLMNLVLLALTVGVSVAAWRGALDLDQLALWREGPRPLQLLSHAFVHADWGHLLGNGICLFAFGNAINRRLGHARYLLLYLALCVLGGAGWLVVDGGQAVIGASGVAMGLGGLFLIAFPRLPMNVLVPAMGYLAGAIVFATAVLAAALGSPGLVAMGHIAAAVIVLCAQVSYLFGSGAQVGGPREGYLLALLGWRAWKLAGCWVAPALLVGDVIALSLGSPDQVAHGAHLFAGVAGGLVGLLGAGSGLLRGTPGQPTLTEWVFGDPPPAAPQPTRRLPARRTTRPAATLSFSDYCRQRLEPAPARSGRYPGP